MNTKQKIVLAIVAIVGLIIIFVYVPRAQTIKTVSVYDIQPRKETMLDKCPVCGETFIYGDGFTRIIVAEYDEIGGRIAPFSWLPVIACRNCGTLRLDLKRISNQPLPALESLEERME